MATEEELRAALSKLIGTIACVRRENTPEFMAYLADRANESLSLLGDTARLVWPYPLADAFQCEVDKEQLGSGR